MTKQKKPDISQEIQNLLVKTDQLLNKKKNEAKKKKCKKCGSTRVYAAGLCKDDFFAERSEREQAREGKIWQSTDGYMRIYVANVPVLYHRYVVEQFLGRKLQRNERVGFKDGDKTNCSLDNLTFEGPIDLAKLACPHCGANFIAPQPPSQPQTKIPLPTQLDLKPYP
jgi:ribosomal protein S27AE